jgi:hypothetical protein
MKMTQIHKWKTVIQASKTGALTLYTVSATYVVSAADKDGANEAAIRRAYQENLEHVRVVRLECLDDKLTA